MARRTIQTKTQRLSATSATRRKTAVDGQAVDAFISAALVILSNLNGKTTTKFAADMKSWASASVPFISAFGLSKLATKAFNVYNLKGTIPEELANELGDAIQSKRQDLEHNNSISAAQLKLLKDIDMQLRTQSVAAWNRIHKDVRVLQNPKLSALFPLEGDEDSKVGTADLKKVGTALAAAVRKATGTKTNRQFLTLNEVKELRTEDTGLLSSYSALVKIVNGLIKKETFNFVRASGQPMVTVEALRGHLAKKGIPNNIAQGFTGGQVDDIGKYYTAEGRPLDSVPFGPVKMNPKYDPEADNTYVFTCEGKRFRTLTFTQSKKVERFSKVRKFIQGESLHRANWVKGLSEDGRTPILAAMVELIYATSSRIGGEGNATAGEPTYGMSTLECRQLSVTPKEIRYDYTGKKLARQGATYPIKDAVSKKVHAIMSDLLKDKGPTDRVFTYRGKPVTRAAVNIYLKELGIDLSIHNFRNVAGTKLALKIIKDAPFKASQKPKQSAVESWFKEAMKEVGVLLHHRTGENVTGMTALKSYIDPSAVLEFFDGLGLRAPSFYK